MIGEPLNDVECLELVTERAAEMVDNPEVREVASRFATTEELSQWIRALPQRNDVGEASDGPRVQCDVPQRLRLPADDPNCVERAALYLSVAERIDSAPLRQLATIDTPIGRHTFAVENAVPVDLDPRVPRNALDAGLWRILDPDNVRNLSARDAFDWILSVSEQPARARRNGKRFRNAERGFASLVGRRRLPRNGAQDIAYVLGLAHEAAGAFGAKGVDIVRLGTVAAQHALRQARRNVVGVRVGGVTIKPDWRKLGALGRVSGRVGLRVGAELVKTKLATMGFGPEVIGAVEQELHTEGLTLGALSEPPPERGTLAALTTTALLQRRLHEPG